MRMVLFCFYIHSLYNVTNMSEFNPALRELKATQSAFDDDNFSGADTP